MKKCKSCQKEIDEKAKKCPHCQSDQRNWFGRHKILTGIIIVIIVFGIIGTVGGNKDTNSATSSTTGTQPTQEVVKSAPIVVDATTLVGEYDKNKLAAQDKYTGKVVQTTGFIKNISNDISGKYYLSLDPTNDQYYFGTTIACYFADKSQKSELTALVNGQSVTVTGKMSDMSLGFVDMQECNIVQ